MANSINFNVNPYFDDFDDDKKFIKILFRPGYSVQSRELNQLQAILQNQIERFGRHMFKDGSMIIPGTISLDNKYYYIKITSLPISVQSSDLIGKTVTDSNGVSATILNVVQYTESNDAVVYILYLKYTASNTSGAEKSRFESGSTLTISELSLTVTAVADVDNVGGSVVGTASVASISEGVFFTQGYFVKVSPQTIFLDQFSNDSVTESAPSYRVGLTVNSLIVTEREDTSLLSNATGSANYAAPGAHRYKIDLVLSKVAIQPEEDPYQSQQDPSFIELLVVKDGVIYKKVDKTDYDIIGDTLARRTMDESGNYTVSPFTVQVKEYLDDGTNQGVYRKYLVLEDIVYENSYTEILQDYTLVQGNATGTVYLYNTTNNRLQFFQTSSEPDNNFADSLTVTIYDGSTVVATANVTSVVGNDYSSKVALVISPGKGYVEGYEIEKVGPTIVPVNRALETDPFYGRTFLTGYGNILYVNNVKGIPHYENFEELSLYALNKDSYGTLVEIGNCKVKQFEYDADSDAPNVENGDPRYFIFLFDINLTNRDYTFEDVRSIRHTTGGSENFASDIIPSVYKESGTITNVITPVTISGTRNTDTTFTRSISTWGTNDLVDQYCYSYVSTSRSKGTWSKIQSNTATTITILGTEPILYTSCDTVEIYNIKYDASIPISGTRSSNTRFTATAGTFGPELVGEWVYSYISGDRTKGAWSQISVVHTGGDYIDVSGNLYGSGSITLIVELYAEQYDNAANGKIFGQGTNFDSQLNVGDILVINYDDRKKRRRFQVTSIESPYYLHYTELINGALDKTAANTVIPELSLQFSGQEVFAEYSEPYQVQNTKLVFKAPDSNLHRLLAPTSGTTVPSGTFYIRKIFDTAVGTGISVVQLGVGLGQRITLTLTDSSDTFEESYPADYIVSQYTSSPPLYGKIYQVSNINMASDKKQVTFDVLAPDGVTQFRVTTTVKKSGTISYQRNKTVQQDYLDLTTTDLANKNIIVLEQLDVTEIEHIWMSADFSTSLPTVVGDPNDCDYSDCIDIQKNYLLDDGQRDNFYDYGRILKKSGSSIISGQIRIIYKYFRHENKVSGFYYSVNSYPDYDTIPRYNSIVLGNTFELRDCIDFRPDVDETNFIIPIASKNFVADYEIYQSRLDKLTLTKDGIFKIVEGTPSDSPVAPTIKDKSMSLYTIEVPAYTYRAADVLTTFIENKRYTMRDIGKLEDRIANLEYYTTLTLLEKETKDLLVIDPITGFNKFKLGFIVDPFTAPPTRELNNTSVGDGSNVDFRCSVDPDEQTCRPDFNEASVNLVPVPTVGDPIYNTRLSYPPLENNVRITDDNVAILDWTTEVTVLEQPYATDTYNVNPYRKFVYIGVLSLNPQVDRFKVTKYLDPLVQEMTLNIPTPPGVQAGKVWNNWEITYGGWSKPTRSEKKEFIGIQAGHDVAGGLNDKAYFLDPNKRIPKDENKQLDLLYKLLEKHGRGWDNFDTGHPRRRVWEERWTVTKSRNVTSRRTGIEYVAADGNPVTRDLGDRVVSVDPAIYIDTILVAFWAKGLKPKTQVYPFFDGIDIKELCSTAKVQDSTGNWHIDTVTSGVQNLITDEKGILGSSTAPYYFEIPDPNKELNKKFNVGTRIFHLTSSKDNTETAPDTKADAMFSAEGITETHQKTILSIRARGLIALPISEEINTIEYNTEDRKRRRYGDWYDPIAQNFRVPSEGGCFITGINIWFKNKPGTEDAQLPVRLQIREVNDDQSPGQSVLPFSDVVVEADQVGTIDYHGPYDVTEPTVVAPSDLTYFDNDPNSDGYGSVYFRFSTPVYLMDDVVYAFVLLSDSDKYDVHVAKTMPSQGDPTVGNYTIVSPSDQRGIAFTNQDNFLGQFYKSENAGTWVADPTIKIKFRMNKAQFVTQGYINFVDDIAESEQWTQLPNDPIQVNRDYTYTPGTYKFRIYHPNHGLRANDIVKLTGIQGVQKYDGSTWVDITSTEQVTFTVGDQDEIDLDSYLATCQYSNLKITQDAIPPTISTRMGGQNIMATTQKKYDVFRPLASVVAVDGTVIEYDLLTLSYTDQTDQLDTQSIPIDQNIYFDNPQLILTSRNFLSSNQQPSMILQCNMESSNANISPVLDIDSLCGIAISNRVSDPVFDDNPVNYLNIISVLDANLLLDDTENTITIQGLTIDPSVEDLDHKFAIGKYIRIHPFEGSNESEPMLIIRKDATPQSGKIVLFVETLEYTKPPLISEHMIAQQDYFVDEIAPLNGSATSKYVTKRVGFPNPGTSLQIMFDAYNNERSTVDVYYKIQKTSDKRNFDDIEYVKANLATPAIASVHYTDFRSDYEYKITNLEPFSAVACKVVFRSNLNDSSDPSKIRQFRLIAMA